MFRDLSVLSSKSDYLALTSTSGLRLFEWILNSCCRAKRACPLSRNLDDCTEEMCRRDEQMERIWPGNCCPPTPTAWSLKLHYLFPSWNTVEQTALLMTTKTRDRSLICGDCEKASMRTPRSAVNSCEMLQVFTWHTWHWITNWTSLHSMNGSYRGRYYLKRGISIKKDGNYTFQINKLGWVRKRLFFQLWKKD